MSARIMLSKWLPSNTRAQVDWPLALLGAALLTLLLPTYWMLAQTVWKGDEQGHGPIILAVTAWLMWNRRRGFLDLRDDAAQIAGWVSFGVGIVLYVIGRSQQVDTIEVLSHIPLIGSALLLSRGWRALKWAAFFLFFLLFTVPLPGLVVQALTTPLKVSVSHVAEMVMYSLGYPVARSGVILYVGQYQLLVADACAGLNSMFTLEALGLLYLNLRNHTGLGRNLALGLLVIPIAFVANVIRVMILVLVTYYFGDEAGQGFVHGFAGMVLFMVALTLMLCADGLLERIFWRPQEIGEGSK